MIWWRQLIGKMRYFIVVYTYQIEGEYTTGHGQLTSKVSGGGYISVDSCIETVEESNDVKLGTFIIDNIIEMNKKDFKLFEEQNTKLKDEESDNDNDIGES